jgi:hypothetical protein
VQLGPRQHRRAVHGRHRGRAVDDQLPAELGDRSGVWINSIAANNSGRANTEFWDNMSADEVSGPGCNAGYFARGTGFAADCKTWGAAAGTPGGYTQWYSKNDRDAAAFTFDEGTYQLRLEGSYAGGTSEVGIFYMKGMTRIFVPIIPFGTKTSAARSTSPRRPPRATTGLLHRQQLQHPVAELRHDALRAPGLLLGRHGQRDRHADVALPAVGAVRQHGPDEVPGGRRGQQPRAAPEHAAA